MLEELARLHDRDTSAADVLLRLVASLRGVRLGLPYDQLTHAVHCAGLAETAGADAEVVVAALVHDVGKLVAPSNHAEIGAAMLAPHVRPEVTYALRVHEDVMREAAAGATADDLDRRYGSLARRFVLDFDRPAQHPGPPVVTLDHFGPVVRQVMGRFDSERPAAASRTPAVPRADDRADLVAGGSARALGRAALARCVGEVDVFLRDVWGRRAARFDDREPFTDLLDERAVESLVRRHQTNPDVVRVVDAGADLGDHPERATPGFVARAYAAGATVALNGLEQRWPPLVRFCRQVELFLSCPVQANAYVTPAGARGLDAHVDDHDVLVLSTRGAKTFRLDESDCTVHPGTALYLPAGVRHEAVASDAGSIHITIGIHATRWSSLLPGLLGPLSTHPALQARLEPGHVYDPESLREAAGGASAALADWLVRMGPSVLAELALDGFVRARPTGYATSTPLAARMLAQTLRAGPTSAAADTVSVRLRPGAIVRLTTGPTGASLTSGATHLTLSPRQATVLRPLLDGGSTSLCRFVTGADENGHRGLLADLLDAGVVEPT